MTLFQYAILFHEKLSESQIKDGARPKHEIVDGPKAILAKDLSQAQLRVARLIPETYADRLDEVEIAIRPF